MHKVLRPKGGLRITYLSEYDGIRGRRDGACSPVGCCGSCTVVIFQRERKCARHLCMDARGLERHSAEAP